MMEIKATIAGSICRMLVKQGDVFKKGEEVVILESMKMEIPIAAEQDGKVELIKLSEGDFVNEGDVIIVFS